MDATLFAEIDAGIAAGATDWQYRGGEPVHARIGGQMSRIGDGALSDERVRAIAAAAIGEAAGAPAEFDGSFEHAGHIFRFHSYRSRGVFSFTLRRLPAAIPRLDALGVPPAFIASLTQANRGLILVTGPTGAGKTTTLAAAIDHLNAERQALILTLEDPIEYRHRHRRGVVRQLEKGQDFAAFADALRGALRIDPDIILLGEMRDRETIAAALAAAETGHLVLATLHCGSAADAVARVAGAFPAGESAEIRAQLAQSLTAVLAQQLLATVEQTAVAAFELLLATPAVRRLIGDPGQNWPLLANELATGGRSGMVAFDASLEALWRQGRISKEEALRSAASPDQLRARLRRP